MGTSKTHRAGSGEKIFRQSKQKTARIVDPMRRFFVTNDGKDSADSPCEGFFRGALKNRTDLSVLFFHHSVIIVSSALDDLHPILSHTVDDTVLIVDAAAPESAEVAP